MVPKIRLVENPIFLDVVTHCSRVLEANFRGHFEHSEYWGRSKGTGPNWGTPIGGDDSEKSELEDEGIGTPGSESW